MVTASTVARARNSQDIACPGSFYGNHGLCVPVSTAHRGDVRCDAGGAADLAAAASCISRILVNSSYISPCSSVVIRDISSSRAPESRSPARAVGLLAVQVAEAVHQAALAQSPRKARLHSPARHR